jgi:hypothetical protein
MVLVCFAFVFYFYCRLLCDSLICSKMLDVGQVALPKESEGFARWFWKTQMIKQLGCIYLKSY